MMRGGRKRREGGKEGGREGVREGVKDRSFPLPLSLRKSTCYETIKKKDRTERQYSIRERERVEGGRGDRGNTSLTCSSSF
jgi:hypothetical protein